MIILIETAKNKVEKERPKIAEAFGMDVFKWNNIVPRFFKPSMNHLHHLCFKDLLGMPMPPIQGVIKG